MGDFIFLGWNKTYLAAFQLVAKMEVERKLHVKNGLFYFTVAVKFYFSL
jgi:hypothetical protein